nr:radical SAM protein [Bradyrhizobium sp. 200]
MRLHTKKALREDVGGAYRAALEHEIVLVSDNLTASVHIARLHWGGGTPSILGAEGLASVMAVLRRHFVLEPGLEHAIELDPRYVTSLLAGSLNELGVNRVSLGVQDVNPMVQAAIGRWQPMQDVAAAVLRLWAAGIGNLNLIYGLPLQTVASLRKTCEIVAMLSPDRIACYGYAHMPRLKANQRLIDEKMLPGAEERIDQAEAIAEEFQRHGFLKIGINHFAKPGDALARAAASGRLHRNFQGYTDDSRETLIGFGASSIAVQGRICPEYLRRSKLCSCHCGWPPGGGARLSARCRRKAARQYNRKPDVRVSGRPRRHRAGNGIYGRNCLAAALGRRRLGTH